MIVVTVEKTLDDAISNLALRSLSRQASVYAVSERTTGDR